MTNLVSWLGFPSLVENLGLSSLVWSLCFVTNRRSSWKSGWKSMAKLAILEILSKLHAWRIRSVLHRKSSSPRGEIPYWSKGYDVSCVHTHVFIIGPHLMDQLHKHLQIWMCPAVESDRYVYVFSGIWSISPRSTWRRTTCAIGCEWWLRTRRPMNCATSRSVRRTMSLRRKTEASSSQPGVWRQWLHMRPVLTM